MNKTNRNNTYAFTFLFLILMAGKVAAQTIPVGEDTLPIYDAIFFDSLSSFTHDQVQVREVPDSTVQQIKQDDNFWYADVAPERNQNLESNGPVLIPGWMKTLVWTVIIISMLAVVIWFLASSNLRLFRKAPSVISGEEKEMIAEDIFSVDFDTEIRKALVPQNFRLAIRLFYLRTLRDLSLRSLIDYKHELTNTDYLAQLAGTSYYRDFFQLTRDFEYVWYGQFNLTPSAFQQVEYNFSRFKEELGS